MDRYSHLHTSCRTPLQYQRERAQTSPLLFPHPFRFHFPSPFLSACFPTPLPPLSSSYCSFHIPLHSHFPLLISFSHFLCHFPGSLLSSSSYPLPFPITTSLSHSHIPIPFPTFRLGEIWKVLIFIFFIRSLPLCLKILSLNFPRPELQKVANFLGLKGTVSRDFLTLVFFIKHLLLVPLDRPRKDFEFFRKFEK